MFGIHSLGEKGHDKNKANAEKTIGSKRIWRYRAHLI